mmetsp:Transcript_88391/g.229329  ORF Transcript_88391/g.229329 Transcript_88391/m.229329 type:complete len:270 (-) Transcript_88391:374-1183(-)
MIRDVEVGQLRRLREVFAPLLRVPKVDRVLHCPMVSDLAVEADVGVRVHLRELPLDPRDCNRVHLLNGVLLWRRLPLLQALGPLLINHGHDAGEYGAVEDGELTQDLAVEVDIVEPESPGEPAIFGAMVAASCVQAHDPELAAVPLEHPPRPHLVCQGLHDGLLRDAVAIAAATLEVHGVLQPHLPAPLHAERELLERGRFLIVHVAFGRNLLLQVLSPNLLVAPILYRLLRLYITHDQLTVVHFCGVAAASRKPDEHRRLVASEVRWL